MESRLKIQKETRDQSQAALNEAKASNMRQLTKMLTERLKRHEEAYQLTEQAFNEVDERLQASDTQIDAFKKGQPAAPQK